MAEKLLELSVNGIGDIYLMADYLGLSIPQLGYLIARNPGVIAQYRKARVINRIRLTQHMIDIAQNSKYSSDKFSATKFLLGALYDMDEQILRLRLANARDEKKYKLDKKKYRHELRNTSHRSALDIAKAIKSMDDSSLERLFNISEKKES